MAIKAKTSSSSTVGTSESMSSVFSSCRTLDIVDLEEGFSGMLTQRVGSHVRYFVRSRKGHQHHNILDTCYLCKRNIRDNCDVYMYRGDLPFCSLECREEQMEMDLSLKRLHQTQMKNQKRNLTPNNQIKCSMEKDSCTESVYRNFGYSIIRDIIALVVG